MSKNFGYLFMGLGILIQIIVYLISKDSLLSLISGVTGVVSVVLCSQRKISFYFWGFIQLFTYIILSLEHNFWGEIFENVFYFITMISGIYIWNTHYDKKNNEVKTNKLSPKWNIYLGISFILFTELLYYILKYTNDTQPFLDSITTVPAFIAQILMIYRFREQWIYWLILDVLSICLWFNAGNYCMVAQFVFWTINCVYGWIMWNKNTEEQCLDK